MTQSSLIKPARQTDANLALVKRTYEGSSSAENAKSLQHALASDARWSEAAGFPYAGTYVGFSAIAANVFARLETKWDNYRVDIEDYVAQGDKVFCLWHLFRNLCQDRQIF
ncbi:nuclear transport factor 2 family protein [Shewanella morhuae]|uniref:nuclear transport factor 2 family protein n=1 Tax=Shewanella morhuae TaxID=365591 RepID=UPI0031342499